MPKRSAGVWIVAGLSLVVLLLVVGALSVYLGHRALTGEQASSAPTTSPSTPIANPISLQALVQNTAGRRFVTSQCTDLQSNLWVGSEDGGVWRFNPSAAIDHQWKDFTPADGLGDEHVTAVACDHAGRIWAGQGRTGVSVWNGESWRNYGAVAKSAGPIGDHVFCIEVCPTDGDVWIGTSAGITRYSQIRDRWTDVTRADGLPSDQVNAISFTPAGDVVVGTQCDGLAIARAADKYSHWQRIDGPEQFLTEPAGDGLPSNRINDVLAVGNDHIYVATPEGLGWSRDGGAHWRYIHGTDWQGKMVDRAAGEQGSRRSVDPVDGIALLPEDYIQSLTLNAKNHVMAACRSEGLVQIVEHDGEIETGGDSAAVEDARLPHASPAYQTAAGYGEGVVAVGESQVQITGQITGKMSESTREFPASSAAPDLTVLNKDLDEIAHVQALQPSADPLVRTLPDDWSTRGEWLGRYGRYQCVISAIAQPDYKWGAAPEAIRYDVMNGPHERAGDSNRYWVSTLYNTDPRSLEIPPVYMHSRVLQKLTTWDRNRRQAEWNDNGETYSTTWEGPDLYCNVDVPAGLFAMSFYEINDDGHSKRSAGRDFELIVKARGSDDILQKGDVGFDAAQTLARSRVVDFYGGVYKRFMVHGPAKLTVKLCRNYSTSCAIVSALMLDQIEARPVPYFSSPEQKAATTQSADSWANDCTACPTEHEAVTKLVKKLDDLRDWNPDWLAINQRRIAIGLARWSLANLNATDQSTARLKAAIFYDAGDYPAYEAAQTAGGEKTARAIEKSLRWDGKSNTSGHEYDVLTHNTAALKLTETKPTTRAVKRVTTRP